MSTCIRASYKRLPGQAFWTWLTGKELADCTDRGAVSPVACTGLATLIYLLSITISLEVLHRGGSWGWLLPSVIATVSSARYLVATVIHHGVHGAVFQSEWANRLLCELLSTITVVQPYDSYRQFHVQEHHGRQFSTLQDQDLAAVYTMGLRPGVPVWRLRCILLWRCVDPVFHLRYLGGRLRSNLADSPWERRILLLAFLALLVFLGRHYGGMAVLAGLVLPLTVPYQICSLLHLVSEHAWLIRVGGESVRDSHVLNSHARFCGRMLPPHHLTGLRWVRSWLSWWAEHLLLHLPARLLIVQGSLIVHDWHHRAGANRNWTQAIQLREMDVQRELARGTCSYTDIWGIGQAIDSVLRRISAGPLPEKGTQLNYRLN